ncbi:lipopolysaccharide biosynthesis protein [Geodermatophilus dictyosporus]|nr:oligosaccharide flippase family protein [Geodermatophilus dictyosporus]
MPGTGGGTVQALPSAVNSLALIAAKVAAMGLGFLFWLVAARIASPTEVGLAAGAVSAMMLCTQFAILGFGSAVITHLKANEGRLPTLLNSALTLVVSASGVLSLVFVGFSGLVLAQLDVVAHSPAFAALFVAAAVFGTLGILLDQTATALRRGDQALVRNVVFGVGTLLGLVAVATGLDAPSAGAVFAPWAVAGALATTVGLWQLRRAIPRYRIRTSVDGPLSGALVRSALPNYALTLAERTPGLLLPVIVTELLAPDTNATWYAVWMMAWIVYIVPVQVGLTVFSEVAADPGSHSAAVRRGVRSSLGIGLLVAGTVAVAADPLLGLLGPHYAEGGATPLRILVLGWLPLTFVHCYYAAARAHRRLREAVAVAVVSAVVSVTAAAAGGVTGGLTAMALAWLAVQTATGAWALLRLRATSPAAAVPRRARPASEASPSGMAPDSGPVRGRVVDGLLLPAAWVLPVVAVVIAWVALRRAEVSGITDLGLVSVLPSGYYVAFVVLAGGFALGLRGRERPALLAFQMVVTVVLLYAVTLPFEQVPRFSVVYRHAGVVDHFLTGGAIDPDIDAYFNWPGFFVLAEFIAEVAGLDGVLPIASYAPAVFNLLVLPALVVIARAATGDWRTVWLSVWIYYLTNWVGQDYLAPQAFAFVLYATLAAAALTTLAGRLDGPPRWWRTSATALLRAAGRRLGAARAQVEVQWPRVTQRERGGVVLACTLMVAAMVASHQLTPFASLLLLLTLVLARRMTGRLLPLIASVLVVAWLTFMAAGYLDGHLAEIWADALSLGSSVGSNVGERVTGSAEHLLVVYARLGLAGVLWLLAAIGVVRMLRHGRPAPGHAVLAFTPLLLVPLQPYGGEILLRSYLFALPFVAVLVAWALFPGVGARWSWRRGGGVVLVSCALLGAFLLTRYGNERASLFTSQERDAVMYLYATAGPEDVVAAGLPNMPWQDRRYDDVDVEILSRSLEPVATPESPRQLADKVADHLESKRGEGTAYLVITRSQLSIEQMMGPPGWGSVQDLQQGALTSQRYVLVYRNADAAVFELREDS